VITSPNGGQERRHPAGDGSRLEAGAPPSF
jgi:hypothetical protein